MNSRKSCPARRTPGSAGSISGSPRPSGIRSFLTAGCSPRNAREHTQHARLGASTGPSRAAEARAGGRDRWAVGVEHGDVALEAEDRPVDDRDTQTPPKAEHGRAPGKLSAPSTTSWSYPEMMSADVVGVLRRTPGDHLHRRPGRSPWPSPPCAFPTRSSCRIWRRRLDSSTTSMSTMPIVPTPKPQGTGRMGCAEDPGALVPTAPQVQQLAPPLPNLGQQQMPLVAVLLVSRWLCGTFQSRPSSFHLAEAAGHRGIGVAQLFQRAGCRTPSARHRRTARSPVCPCWAASSRSDSRGDPGG